MNGNATQTGSALQLTPPTTDQAGSAFFLDAFDDARFVATFDLRFDNPSSPGADGIDSLDAGTPIEREPGIAPRE